MCAVDFVLRLGGVGWPRGVRRCGEGSRRGWWGLGVSGRWVLCSSVLLYWGRVGGGARGLGGLFPLWGMIVRGRIYEICGQLPCRVRYCRSWAPCGV